MKCYSIRPDSSTFGGSPMTGSTKSHHRAGGARTDRGGPEFFERTRDEGWSGRNKNIDRLVLIDQIKFSTMPQSLSIFDFYIGILVFIVQASNTCPVMDSDTSNLAINLQYLHLDLCPNFSENAFMKWPRLVFEIWNRHVSPIFFRPPNVSVQKKHPKASERASGKKPWFFLLK